MEEFIRNLSLFMFLQYRFMKLITGLFICNKYCNMDSTVDMFNQFLSLLH
jgi:hypothetical protein